jgi:hypothetical protein
MDIMVCSRTKNVIWICQKIGLQDTLFYGNSNIGKNDDLNSDFGVPYFPRSTLDEYWMNI